MSFIITIYTREGFVMASDSRITLNRPAVTNGQQTLQLSVSQSDSANKTFLGPNDIGISTCGDASIGATPISGYIESFIREVLNVSNTVEIDEVPKLINQYFRNISVGLNTQFIIAGYKTENKQRVQHVWRTDVVQNQVTRVNVPTQQGATWGGENDVLVRLTRAVDVFDANKAKIGSLDAVAIPFEFFTLQDAIDFAIYAVDVTIESLRFQMRPKTVGGPIDVLVIKPDGAFWVQKKDLAGQILRKS